MWKIIPNTDNKYQCNKDGDIMRVNEIVSFGSQFRKIGGKPLSQKTKANGYKEVNLYLEKNKGASKYVHRLIAQTFLGEIPKGYNINHRDGDKNNNNLSNLEIVTFSENQRHAYKMGLIKHNAPKGSQNVNSKLTEKDVLLIREYHRKTKSLKMVCELYPHLHKGTLGKIIYRNSWTHI